MSSTTSAAAWMVKLWPFRPRHFQWKRVDGWREGGRERMTDGWIDGERKDYIQRGLRGAYNVTNPRFFYGSLC